MATSHPFSSHASSAFANRQSPASSLQVTSSSIEQGQALICRTPKAGGPARSGDLDYCARGGPDLSGPLFFPPALPAAAASSMEATGHAVAEAAAYAVAEASDMGDTHAVGETATPKMGDIYAAVGETVTSDMGDTYAAETHAGMGNGPPGAYARVAEAVADFTVSAIVGAIAAVGGVGAISAIRAIGIIGCAGQGTAVSQIVYGPGRTGILVGIGLRSSRL